MSMHKKGKGRVREGILAIGVTDSALPQCFCYQMGPAVERGVQDDGKVVQLNF